MTNTSLAHGFRWVVLASIGALTSCSAITNFDRFHPAGGGDAGTDGSRPDAGQCTTPVDELCNERDDDCDTNVDEDFNLQTDIMNCGTCARECGAVTNGAPDCSGGDCVPDCSLGYGDCDGAYATGCETDLTNPDTCGSCTSVCASDEVCSATMGCVTTCPGSEEVCSRSCVNTQTSLTHCGGCDNACPTPDHAIAVCAAGSCDFTCMTGFDDCDGLPDNGCETALDTTSDCGTCGTSCSYAHGVASCDGTACMLMACLPGFDDCDGNVANGCEADLGSLATCTACGTSCTAPAHASATCGATGCGFTCDSGFEDCDGMAANGCEADLAADSTCGTCTNVCMGATPLCNSGTCVTSCSAPTPDRCGMTCTDLSTDPSNCLSCGTVCTDRPNSSPTCASPAGCSFACDSGFANCNGTAPDGCERSTTTLTDCGSCGTACVRAHATATCGTGTCAISACDTGWANCDGMDANGCETPTTTVTNCGSCGNICAVAHGTPSCVASSCTIGMCGSGFGDCNMMYADGCEQTLSTYYLDMDGDTYGRNTGPMTVCSPPPMYVTRNGDCNDGDPAVYPMAPALCEMTPVDNDCDSNVDEGYGVGGTCSCEVGAASGSVRCTSTTTSACAYPTEVCNGADDDCDGNDDNGFMCVGGSSRSCSTGCGSTGTESCTSACMWAGGCVPPAETCNFLDDDCDFNVDEGRLGIVGTQEYIVPSADYGGSIDIAYNPISSEVGFVYFNTCCGSPSFALARVRADLTSQLGYYNIGGPGTTKTNPRVEVTSTGSYFVAYQQGSSFTYAFLAPPSYAATWSTYSFGQVLDFLAAPSGGDVYVLFHNGGGIVQVRSIDPTSGPGPSISLPTAPGAVDAGAMSLVQSDLAVAIGGSTANFARYYRVTPSGTVVHGPVSLLPAGHTFDVPKPRSIYMDRIPGAAERVGVTLHTRMAGNTYYSTMILNTLGMVTASASTLRGSSNISMDMSTTEASLAVLVDDDIVRRLMSGPEMAPYLGTGASQDSIILGEQVGSIRFYTVGRDASAGRIRLQGVGCAP
ncbi:MAG: MopE-related protein [Sandaracinaceae bacterium]